MLFASWHFDAVLKNGYFGHYLIRVSMLGKPFDKNFSTIDLRVKVIS